MNPDNYHNVKTWDEHPKSQRTWTISMEGIVYVFRQYGHNGRVEVIEPNGGKHVHHHVDARKIWDGLVKQGYRLQNSCHHWDMEEFYDMKRKEEEGKEWISQPSLDSIYNFSPKERKRRKTQRMKSAMTSFDKMKKELKYENYALEA